MQSLKSLWDQSENLDDFEWMAQVEGYEYAEIQEWLDAHEDYCNGMYEDTLGMPRKW